MELLDVIQYQRSRKCIKKILNLIDAIDFAVLELSSIGELFI